jgi:hypothetical protein
MLCTEQQCPLRADTAGRPRSSPERFGSTPVSAFLAWIWSPCLRHCGHGASIGARIGATQARGIAPGAAPPAIGLPSAFGRASNV